MTEGRLLQPEKALSPIALAAYCMVALLLTALVVGLIGMPNTRGKSLQQITRERYGEDL